jgi:hypothetical protein
VGGLAVASPGFWHHDIDGTMMTLFGALARMVLSVCGIVRTARRQNGGDQTQR